MNTHPPEQIYSEEAANVGFIIAIGIMGAVAIILLVGILLAAFYIRMSDGIEVGAATLLVLCVISAFPPLVIALRYINKCRGCSSH